MTARVMPFPAIRRTRLIRDHALMMLKSPPSAAEKYLRQRIDAHTLALARKGVDRALIQSDVKAMESAIRVEIWRQTFGCGGSA